MKIVYFLCLVDVEEIGEMGAIMSKSPSHTSAKKVSLRMS